MARVSSADLKRLLGLTWELHAHDRLETLPETLMRLTAAVVEADITSYNEVNGRARRFLGVVDQPIPKMLYKLQMLQRFAAEHPVLRHYEASHDELPVKISDFITRPQLHNTGVYQEVYRDMGVNYQMVVPVWTQPLEKIVAVTVNRRTRDFSERDRTILSLLQPHIREAYVRLERLHALEMQRDDLGAVLADMTLALVVLDEQLGVTRVRGPAAEWLHRFFPAGNGGDLPHPLLQWVRAARERWRLSDPATPPPPESPRCIESDERQLWVQISPGPQPGETHVLLREKPRPGAGSALKKLGLTNREAEVLFWLTQGKSNAEIGRILGIASRTVHKHLERVYARLGVENRAAAVARAIETANGSAAM